MPTLILYVPHPDSDLREEIWRGSGIVGSPVEDTGRIRLDFEGDDDVYPTYRDRVRRAAERHQWSDGERTGYPTSACAHVDEDEVVAVGTYDTDADRLTVEDPDTLQDWLDGEEVPDPPQN